MTSQLSVTASVRRPGRLDNPAMSLRDDPRADPRMISALAPVGLDGPAAPMPVPLDAPREQLLAVVEAMEAGFEALFARFAEGLEPVPGVTSETITIAGPDGGELALYVHRPTAVSGSVSGSLPGVVHLHGGGMVLLEAAGPAYGRWRDSLAATGMVVIGVEFRNGGGKLGAHPYPAGLDDCVTATRWVLDNVAVLGIDKLIISGESGGGNLSLAVTLRANREGWVDRIAGVYALCPFISGEWASPPPELASLHENDGYFLSCEMLALLAAVYDPTGGSAADPLCWPLRATDADLAGLPPHVISVNEVDPLRDEGLTYQRRLVAAGVSAVGRTVAGTCHGAEVMLPAALPDIYAATIRDIKAFAASR